MTQDFVTAKYVQLIRSLSKSLPNVTYIEHILTLRHRGELAVSPSIDLCLLFISGQIQTCLFPNIKFWEPAELITRKY